MTWIFYLSFLFVIGIKPHMQVSLKNECREASQLLFFIMPYVGVPLIVSFSEWSQMGNETNKPKRSLKRSQGNKADWGRWGASKILYHHVSNLSGSAYHIIRTSWIQVNCEILEGWSRQQGENKGFLRRILDQALLSIDRSCIQTKPILLLCPGKHEGDVPKGGTC